MSVGTVVDYTKKLNSDSCSSLIKIVRENLGIDFESLEISRTEDGKIIIIAYPRE